MELPNWRIEELIKICKESQGEYLGAGHGPGSWATTYSLKFIYAAAELYCIFDSNGYAAIDELSSCFKKEGILSCRRTTMSFSKVQYLYQTHLHAEVTKIKSKR